MKILSYMTDKNDKVVEPRYPSELADLFNALKDGKSVRAIHFNDGASLKNFVGVDYWPRMIYREDFTKKMDMIRGYEAKENGAKPTGYDAVAIQFPIDDVKSFELAETELALINS